LKAAGAEIAFLAVPHGVASEYAKPLLELGLKVIDLSADFRLRSAALYEEFYGHAHPAPELLDEAVYALPEVRAEQIKSARLIACPGCYPTSILLPLIPLLKAGLLADSPSRSRQHERREWRRAEREHPAACSARCKTACAVTACRCIAI
jgi:N-acetyl-gamma-glutamyl-phosphate reductase